MKHFKFLTFLFTFSLLVQTDAREVSFSWEPMEGASGYEIQVTDKRSFKKPIQQEKLESPAYTTELPVGRFYYRVRAVDHKGRSGRWSSPMKVLVKPYSPELISPIDLSEYTYFEILPDISFTWKPDSNASYYDILITRSNGKKILEKHIKDSEFNTDKLSEGEYTWKVRTKFKNKLKSPYSESKKFKIIKNDIKPPVLVAPVDKIVLPAYRPVDFAWKKDVNMKFTDLLIDQKDKKKGVFEVPNKIENQEGESYQLPYIEQGTYEWKVNTKEGKNTKGVTVKPWSFEVRNDLVSKGNFTLEGGYSYGLLSGSFSQTRVGGGGSGTYKSSGLFSNFHADYFWSDAFGLGMDLQSGSVSPLGTEVPFKKEMISFRLRIGSPGFNQQVYLGYRNQNAYDFINSPSTATNVHTMFGPVVGTQFTFSLSDNLSMSFSGIYFKPTGVKEGKEDFSGDVYEIGTKLSWNPFFKFWISAHLKYNKGVMSYSNIFLGNSSWNYTVWEPVYFTLSIRH